MKVTNEMNSLVKEATVEVDKIAAEYETRRREMQELISNKAKGVMKDVFGKIFETYPFVTCIAWTQYTPYFNDGEECIFGVNEANYTTSEKWQDMSPYDFEETTPSEPGDYARENADKGDKYYIGRIKEWDDFVAKHGKDAVVSLNNEMGELNRFLSGMDEHLKIMFGDHVVIYATKDGIEVQEYDHD